MASWENAPEYKGLHNAFDPILDWLWESEGIIGGASPGCFGNECAMRSVCMYSSIMAS